ETQLAPDEKLALEAGSPTASAVAEELGQCWPPPAPAPLSASGAAGSGPSGRERGEQVTEAERLREHGGDGLEAHPRSVCSALPVCSEECLHMWAWRP
ncbi:hypothetical protein MC885_006937, partial [Smutsia gigantea]